MNIVQSWGSPHVSQFFPELRVPETLGVGRSLQVMSERKGGEQEIGVVDRKCGLQEPVMIGFCKRYYPCT